MPVGEFVETEEFTDSKILVGFKHFFFEWSKLFLGQKLKNQIQHTNQTSFTWLNRYHQPTPRIHRPGLWIQTLCWRKPPLSPNWWNRAGESLKNRDVNLWRKERNRSAGEPEFIWEDLVRLIFKMQSADISRLVGGLTLFLLIYSIIPTHPNWVMLGVDPRCPPLSTPWELGHPVDSEADGCHASDGYHSAFQGAVSAAGNETWRPLGCVALHADTMKHVVQIDCWSLADLSTWLGLFWTEHVFCFFEKDSICLDQDWVVLLLAKLKSELTSLWQVAARCYKDSKHQFARGIGLITSQATNG